MLDVRVDIHVRARIQQTADAVRCTLSSRYGISWSLGIDTRGTMGLLTNKIGNLDGLGAIPRIVWNRRKQSKRRGNSQFPPPPHSRLAPGKINLDGNRDITSLLSLFPSVQSVLSTVVVTVRLSNHLNAGVILEPSLSSLRVKVGRSREEEGQMQPSDRRIG